MNILVACDHNIIVYAKELFYSLFRNNGKNLNIYLMYINIDEALLLDLEKFVMEKCYSKIHFIKVNDLFEQLPTTNKQKTRFFGKEAYLRLFAAWYLPKDIEKILYLDIDIICDGALNDFYNLNLDNNYLIGCRDYGIKRKDLERLNLNENTNYINSGVLIINLKLMREKLNEKIIVSEINKIKDVLEYPDQDFINVFFKNNIKVVENKYNYTLSVMMPYQYKDITIYHYSGGAKPWNSKRYILSFKSICVYLKYLKKTQGWFKAINIISNWFVGKLKNKIDRIKGLKK